MVLGSDEEQALVNAAHIAFPHAKQLFCMLHCKDNVHQHLTSLGVAYELQERVLTKLFGCHGVSEAPDAVTMDDRTADLLQFVRTNNIDAVQYLQERILPKISQNNRHRWQDKRIGQQQWTNNNCESVNHLLKRQVCNSYNSDISVQIMVVSNML